MTAGTSPRRGSWLSPLRVEDLTGQGEHKGDRPFVELLSPLLYLPSYEETPEELAPAGRLTDLRPIFVPTGFRCDAASIPRLVWGIYPPWSKANRAAVVHDYLCSIQVCSREQADWIFRDALLACGVSNQRAWIMWKAVRIGGGGRWDREPPEKIQLAREHARRYGGTLEVSR